MDELKSIDLKIDPQRERLHKAVEKSYEDWDSFRKLNRALVEEFAGDGYGASSSMEGHKREVIINLMHQTVDVYTMALAANRPKVLVTTLYPQLRPFARHFQEAMNNLLETIGVEHVIRRWVLDAFFCIGIVKVHMADSGFVQVEQDRYADPGRPFASNVSLDNFVVDTSARKWSEVEFIGDIYRIAYEDLKDEAIYDQKLVENIRPSSKSEIDPSRLENISTGFETDNDEFVPMVDLIDLWIPREEKVLTYPCTCRHGKLVPYGPPIAEMDWTGSEFGPYPILSFNEVPENLMPTSPASHLAPLAKYVNNVYRKQILSARQFKENPVFKPGAEASARNLINARHGEAVCVEDPNEISTIRMGGVDQQNQMFLLNMMDHFNLAAGNPGTLAGLGQQADTLGQEKLLHGAAGGRVAQMANRVLSSVRQLVRDLGRLLWEDEVNIIPGEIGIEGLDGFEVSSPWMPGDREGTLLDYHLDVDVNSMPYKSPQDRANTILTLIQQVYMPMSEQLMMQGGSINMRKLTDILSELLDLPRMKEVIEFSGVGMSPEDMMMGMGGGRGGGMPANTTREYIRRSAGSMGGTPESRNVSQQQAWSAVQGRE